MPRILGIQNTPTASDELANKTYAEAGGGGGGGSLPAGTILPFAGSTTPSGYLFCDGSAVSRTTYSVLFAAIGTSFGVGDGSTTFNLPDMRDRLPIGYHASGPGNTNTLNGSGGSFNHTHTVPAHSHTMANHTHTMGSHIHGMSHAHGLASHVHDFGHTHTIPTHDHGLPGHYHNFSLSLANTSHSHTQTARNTGTAGTNNQPRDGDGSGTANASGISSGNDTHTHTVGGSIGSGVSGDTTFNTFTNSLTSGNIADPNTGTGISNTGGPSNATDTYSGNTAAPTTNVSGTPSTNTTSTDGAAVSGAANPPYLVCNFIIRHL